jgi:triacylglycerol lipase
MRAARPLLAALAVLLAACADPAGLTGPGARAARKPAPPPPAKNPILFVHGWNSTGAIWDTMKSRFLGEGWTEGQLAAISYDSRQSNATTATQLAKSVDSLLAVTGATQVDIVTHSMGALSARHYVRFAGGDGKVEALVSLGGPNHGTNTALFCFDASCREMLPNSTFLATLNQRDETWGAPRYATWWSGCDEVINPQTSVPLSGAANTQTRCLRHSDLYVDATVYAQVRAFVYPAASAATLIATRTP